MDEKRARLISSLKYILENENPENKDRLFKSITAIMEALTDNQEEMAAAEATIKQLHDQINTQAQESAMLNSRLSMALQATSMILYASEGIAVRAMNNIP